RRPADGMKPAAWLGGSDARDQRERHRRGCDRPEPSSAHRGLPPTRIGGRARPAHRGNLWAGRGRSRGDDRVQTRRTAMRRMLVLAGAISRYPVARTRLLVLDARRLRARARIVLPGAFAVDAISPTGRWLYLIHSTSSRDTTRYDVRAYDVPGHHLVAAPVVDPRERDEAMRGLPMTRAVSADGRWAYT